MRELISAIVASGVLFLAAGCDCAGALARRDDGGTNQGGDGEVPSRDGGMTPRRDATIPVPNCSEIAAVVRDFDPSTHPDFEDENPGHVSGLVEEMLGPDRKPVYAHGDQHRGGIENAESFAQWYRDVEGVNLRFEIRLPLVEETPGHFVHDNPYFFPLDGMGFGNSGRDQNGQERNFHFTTEIHTSFIYEGGETFTFRGDDDLWLFINDRLVIDLGGVHGAIEDTVDLDELGLTPNQRYSMDIFHAERHTSASNFRIETTIRCFMGPF